MINDKPKMARREFLKNCSLKVPQLALICSSVSIPSLLAATNGEYRAEDHDYAMGIDIHKCIGCGRCADACKNENLVPRDIHFFRTWVERYAIMEGGEAAVDSPNGGIDGFPEVSYPEEVLRSFFVPKLCNHCDNPPCVQVCPVGATFQSPDGVVLVDDSYCVGCRYCVQACPYGARFMHPEKHVADKCTFCYHRITKGLLPACVEVCPTQARVFGEIGRRSSPMRRFVRSHDITVLKASLNTKPKVYYAGADGEVR